MINNTVLRNKNFVEARRFFWENEEYSTYNSSYSGVKTSIEKLKLIHLALVSLGFGTE